MMKDNQVSENYFSTRSGKRASEFAGILNGGLCSKRRFAVVALFRFLIGCFIGSFRTESKLMRWFISASALEVGRIV